MKEITYKDWIKNPTPRMMWVWDDDWEEKQKKIVIYIHPEKKLAYKVIALDKPDFCTTFCWAHCAEIEKTRKMTYQELSWWLMDGIKEGKHREWCFDDVDINSTIHAYLDYLDKESNIPVENIFIREDGGEWHEPLMEE